MYVYIHTQTPFDNLPYVGLLKHMYVCVHTYVYITCTYIYIYITCTYVHIYRALDTHVSTHMYIRTCISHVRTYMYTLLLIHMYQPTCTYVRVYVSIYRKSSIYRALDIHMYVYVHTQTPFDNLPYLWLFHKRVLARSDSGI